MTICTVAQVAEILSVAPNTVLIWLRSGKMHGFKIGGRKLWRIREDDMQAFLNAHSN